jgi:hypothetical protein
MHDCRQTQDNLVDLMFDELDFATRARVRAEVEACAGCSAQYRSFTATLAACDEASAALTPRESYWPQYHDALGRRLALAADVAIENVTTAKAPTESVSFWKRLLTTSIRVPAPLAATAMLIFVASSILALTLLARPAPEPVVLAAPPASTQELNAPQIKLIEVPVVQEKIITQIVYVPRRRSTTTGGGGAAGGDNPRRQLPRENLAGVNSSKASSPAALPRANLSGFKPAGEMNLRIIKGSSTREQ